MFEHRELKEVKFNYDKLFFNRKVEKNIKIQDYIQSAPIAGVLQKSIIFEVGIYWMFVIMEEGRDVLFFGAEDTYFTKCNISQLKENIKELDRTINESYRSFSNLFDKKREELNILLGVPVLSKDEISQARQSIISHCQSKVS